MTALWAFLVSNKLWLIPVAVFVLATLKTKLSNYPEGSPANELSGLIQIFLMFLDRVSPLPHAGTEPHATIFGVGVNIPGKRSTPPGSNGSSVSPSPALLVAFLLPLALLVSACCVLHGNCPKGSLGACETDAIKSEVPNLLPILAEVFMHGSGNLEFELAQLGKIIGVDALTCAVQAFESQSGAKLAQLRAGNPASSPQPWLNVTGPEILVGNSRAKEWIAAHGTK